MISIREYVNVLFFGSFTANFFYETKKKYLYHKIIIKVVQLNKTYVQVLVNFY